VIAYWDWGIVVAGWRLTMNRVFAHTEWVQFVIAAVVLWLLMMVAIEVLDLRTVT
jgi:hypothetical protein